MKNTIMDQIKQAIHQHGGKVEYSEGHDRYHTYSIPASETEWFDVWRWTVPFQVLCHGTGPQSEPEHKQRLHFGIWYHVSLGMTCPHCSALISGPAGKVK